MPINKLVVRYAAGGPGMPFFRYAAAVRHCVAISPLKIYLSSPSGTPPSAHLKQRSAVVVSCPVSSAMVAYYPIDGGEFDTWVNTFGLREMGYTCRDKIAIRLDPAHFGGIRTWNSTKGLEVRDNDV
jgi:hypothetical protein